MELEACNLLAFLDDIIPNINNTLSHTVYRKLKKHVNGDSSYHPSQLATVDNWLLQEARWMYNKRHLGAKLRNFKQILLDNELQISLLHNNNCVTPTRGEWMPAVLLYITGLTVKISNIKAALTLFKPPKKIRYFLPFIKCNTVYQDPGV